jgi:hypothetical protein
MLGATAQQCLLAWLKQFEFSKDAFDAITIPMCDVLESKAVAMTGRV